MGLKNKKVKSIDSFYEEKYLESVAELKKLNAMTVLDADVEVLRIHKKTIKENKEYCEKYDKKNQVYIDMMEKVRAWKPPTIKHINLKDFMIQQIETNMYDTRYYKDEPKLISGINWLHQEIKCVQEDILTRKERWDEQRQRVLDSQRWCDALTKSIKEL